MLIFMTSKEHYRHLFWIEAPYRVRRCEMLANHMVSDSADGRMFTQKMGCSTRPLAETA